MASIKGFDEIEAELASHPGKIAHDEWQNLNRIYADIYIKNRKEVVYLLTAPSNDDNLSIELFQNVRPTTIKEVYTNEVLRGLFNYLSSLSSLVDAGIRLTKKYSEEQLSEYITLKNKIVESEINTFFNELRNYIQHYGIPPLGWNIQLNNDRPNSCTYYLRNAKLLEWSSWTKKSKLYIGDKDVNLLEAINEHGSKIDQAYDKFLLLFSSLHSEDVDSYNKLLHRRNDILSGKIKL